jgi:hypothetical protein
LPARKGRTVMSSGIDEQVIVTFAGVNHDAGRIIGHCNGCRRIFQVFQVAVTKTGAGRRAAKAARRKLQPLHLRHAAVKARQWAGKATYHYIGPEAIRAFFSSASPRKPTDE